MNLLRKKKYFFLFLQFNFSLYLLNLFDDYAEVLIKILEIIFFQFINYLLFSYYLIISGESISKVITEDDMNLREKIFFPISCLSLSLESK